jgi:hypothetical protein
MSRKKEAEKDVATAVKRRNMVTVTQYILQCRTTAELCAGYTLSYMELMLK